MIIRMIIRISVLFDLFDFAVSPEAGEIKKRKR